MGAEGFRGLAFGKAPGGSSGGGSINIFRKYGSDLVPRNYDVNGGIVLSVRGGSGTFTTGVISNSFFKE